MRRRSTMFAGGVAALLLAGCGGTGATAGDPAIEATAVGLQRGIVRMRPDRALEITLLGAADGGRVDEVRIVPPEHRDYDAILATTGPMAPGDQRPYVEPRP